MTRGLDFKQTTPLDSLQQQQWFKLICGASYQHLPTIRNLALVYALAGADCIDMAADPAVIRAAREGMQAAQNLRPDLIMPWLMVSVNDGEDPHFRKAFFNVADCLAGCDRPCERVCPTRAIQFAPDLDLPDLAVAPITADLCYGCGRCLPICPVQIIQTREQVYAPEQLAANEVTDMIEAIEIHTQPDRLLEFAQLWQRLTPLLRQLKLVSVSFPDCPDLEDYLKALLQIMQPLPPLLIWQTDGRPMSGDIGHGASRAALQLGQKVLDFQLPQGYVQLAGGTNDSTISRARLAKMAIAGIAYGSFARKIVANLLDSGGDRLEQNPDLLWQAVDLAKNLVLPLKSSQ